MPSPEFLDARKRHLIGTGREDLIPLPGEPIFSPSEPEPEPEPMPAPEPELRGRAYMDLLIEQENAA